MASLSFGKIASMTNLFHLFKMHVICDAMFAREHAMTTRFLLLAFTQSLKHNASTSI